MENLDLIFATTLVSILFIVFGIITYKEFSEASRNIAEEEKK